MCSVKMFKDKLTYKEKVTCKTSAEKCKAKYVMCVAKSCHISEVTCKMEISSIEEHNTPLAFYATPLALYATPLCSCKNILPTSKQFRNKMRIFITFKLIHHALFFAHNMCSI